MPYAHQVPHQMLDCIPGVFATSTVCVLDAEEQKRPSAWTTADDLNVAIAPGMYCLGIFRLPRAALLPTPGVPAFAPTPACLRRGRRAPAPGCPLGLQDRWQPPIGVGDAALNSGTGVAPLCGAQGEGREGGAAMQPAEEVGDATLTSGTGAAPLAVQVVGREGGATTASASVKRAPSLWRTAPPHAAP